jgi:hypothetical protein
MLCEFANRFPRDLAILLERDRHLTRNFREETATDLLMMGLVPLQPCGVRVDFPDETATGADMDWIYAAPLEVGGGSYLRLMIQAKRSKMATLKDGSTYWYYDHLDHGTPKGSQAQTLVTHAASKPDGMDTLPLYMFYHPEAALEAASGKLPAVEGVNIRLARDIVGTVAGGCKRKEKKVGHWRSGFMSLSDLLCWPIVPEPAPAPPPTGAATEFLLPGGFGDVTYLGMAFHPELIAERINLARGEPARAADPDFQVRPSEGLPPEIRRAIAGDVTEKDRKALERPRVILSTPLTRDNPRFALAREAVRRRRGRPAGN